MKVRIAALVFIAFAAVGVFHPALRAQQAARSVWDGVYTEEQAKRGKALYTKECASCHGPELAGGEEPPALSGSAFLANWDGLTVGDLSERVRLSMPPNKLGKLSRQQIVDVLGHVLSVNGFPPGKTELERETELLKQIRIDASKPKEGSGAN